ncbi:hypothetical protein MASR2M16_14830 [Thauera terpenica]
MTTPLESARQRLRAALEAGEDTAPHRAAIARLEADASRRKAEETSQRAAIDADRRRAVSARTEELVAEAKSSIDAVIDSLPKIPTLEIPDVQP